MTASVPVVAIPRRGLHQLDRFQVATSFPFGFIKRAVNARRRDVLLVHPPIAQVDGALLRTCRSADTSGATMRPRAGGADEFYGVKDYRPGDNPRWIYWRRSARSGKMVSKLMTQVAPPRVLLLVNTFLDQRTAERHAAVEHSIAMAASLAIEAIGEGLSVGLCAWSEGVGPRFRPAAASATRTNCCRCFPDCRSTRPAVCRSCSTPPNWSCTAGPRRSCSRPATSSWASAKAQRGGMLLIPADSHRARWFRFDPSVDFQTCMPADQQPRIKRASERAGFRVRGSGSGELGRAGTRSAPRAEIARPYPVSPQPEP